MKNELVIDLGKYHKGFEIQHEGNCYALRRMIFEKGGKPKMVKGTKSISYHYYGYFSSIENAIHHFVKEKVKTDHDKLDLETYCRELKKLYNRIKV